MGGNVRVGPRRHRWWRLQCRLQPLLPLLIRSPLIRGDNDAQSAALHCLVKPGDLAGEVELTKTGHREVEGAQLTSLEGLDGLKAEAIFGGVTDNAAIPRLKMQVSNFGGSDFDPRRVAARLCFLPAHECRLSR